jgi:hypothetical protein
LIVQYAVTKIETFVLPAEGLTLIFVALTAKYYEVKTEFILLAALLSGSVIISVFSERLSGLKFSLK